MINQSEMLLQEKQGSGRGWSRNLLLYLLCGFSMALGWRIRGQFGHEMGAAIPGAMGGLAITLAAGKEIWWKRSLIFALLAGVGWSFGGSISYMKVIGFTHSSDSMTVLYGFAGLYLLGFCWAACGGAGTAMAADLSSAQLKSLLGIMVALFIAWFLKDFFTNYFENYYLYNGDKVSLDWYDTDWLAAAVAIGVGLIAIVLQRKISFGASLVLHASLGWWLGFGLLVLLLKLRLNPPRSDNWAGSLGMTAGIIVFLHCYELKNILRVTVITGFVGAALFSIGQMIKLILISTDMSNGHHVAMESIHGLFFGLVLVGGMHSLIKQKSSDVEGKIPYWCQAFGAFFLFWILPYYNLLKSPLRWIREFPSFPENFYGLSAVGAFFPSRGIIGWMEILFLTWLVILITQLLKWRKTLSPLLPQNSFGKTQLILLVFIWMFTFISFTSEIAETSPMNFIIQWGITMNALFCTWLIFRVSPEHLTDGKSNENISHENNSTQSLRTVIICGLILAGIIIGGGWSLKRALFADEFAGAFPRNHIRFGSENTNHLK